MDCCVQGSICFEWMKGVPAAFVALVIGLIAAGITWRQYKVAKAKLKLDLFERRLAIFQKTWEILSLTVKDGTREKNWGLGTPFNNFLPEASFLFGPEIGDYLSLCIKHWTELYGLQAEKYSDQGKDRQKNIERSTELTNWFFEQASTGCKAKFGKYLDFANWK
jgi:hypothetical protein